MAPEFGIDIVSKESFGPTDTDMTAQLTKAKNATPQALICLDHRTGRRHRLQE